MHAPENPECMSGASACDLAKRIEHRTSPDKINRTNFEISVFVGRAFFNVGLSGEGKYDEHFLLIGVLVKTIHINIVERAGSENLDLKICSVNFVRTWPTCKCYFLALHTF